MILILSTIVVSSDIDQKPSNCPQMASFCSCFSDEISGDLLRCDNFDSFVDLNFTQLKNRSFRSFQLHPREKLVLNKTLNLQTLNLNGTKYNKVQLQNIQSFDLKSNPFEDVNPKIIKILDIINSSIVFLSNNQSRCDRNSGYNRTIFTSFKLIHLYDNNYSNLTCPFAFHDVNLERLTISGLTLSNKFQFEKLTDDEGVFLNSNINYFYIFKSNISKLDENILDKFTFKHIKHFTLDDSNLDAIDDGIFSNFKHLKTIELGLYNMKDFISKPNSMNWFSSLNLNGSSIVDKQFVITLDDQTPNVFYSYRYPDEDFCKFILFPHDKNVFIEIGAIAGNVYECTCTLLWLLQNFQSYDKNYISVINNTFVSHCLGSNFNESIERCQFKQKVSNCKTSYELIGRSKVFIGIMMTLMVIILLIVGFIIYYVWWFRNRKIIEKKKLDSTENEKLCKLKNLIFNFYKNKYVIFELGCQNFLLLSINILNIFYRYS